MPGEQMRIYSVGELLEQLGLLKDTLNAAVKISDLVERSLPIMEGTQPVTTIEDITSVRQLAADVQTLQARVIIWRSAIAKQ